MTKAKPSSLRPDMEGFSSFLRKRHPYGTAKGVAIDTGVPAGSVQHWLQGENAISTAHLLAVLDAYGPDALIALWPSNLPIWLDELSLNLEIVEFNKASARLEQRIRRRNKAGDG